LSGLGRRSPDVYVRARDAGGDDDNRRDESPLSRWERAG